MTITRRKFLCNCGGGVLLAGCGGNESGSGSTPTAQDVGCALYSTTYSSGTACNQTVLSSGTGYDAQVASEFGTQRSFFQLPSVGLQYINDCQPNAYADPRTRNILLGVNLMSNTLNAYKTQRGAFFTLLPLYAVLAHEFGHQVQFAYGWFNNADGVVQEELEADMWAGFYVGMRGLSSGFQVKQTMEQFYNFGNYDFFNSNFHGTPYQRANAFTDGLLAADEIAKGKLQATFEAVRARLQELVAVELRYPSDLSPGVTSKSDIRQQCEQYKVPGTYQECATQLGFSYDSLPNP